MEFKDSIYFNDSFDFGCTNAFCQRVPKPIYTNQVHFVHLDDDDSRFVRSPCCSTEADKTSKEMTLISTVAIYLVLIASVAIHDVWKWESIFDKQGITKLSLVMFSVLALYGIIVYFRAKVSYKRVKGNQQHNNKWRVSEREKRKLKESNDIYLILGKVYENPKD